MSAKKKNGLEALQEGYEAIAEDFSRTRSRGWDDMTAFLPYIKAGDRLLDLGCGNGRLLNFLAEHEARVDYVGVDKSPGLIEAAKEKYPGRNFQVMDALDLNFADESFEVVVSAAVMNHLPTRELHLRFLTEAKRVLKPGGHLLLTNWNMWNLDNKKGLAAFNLDKDGLSDQDFVQKYQVKKEDLAERDVLTIWGEKIILYYHAFSTDELEELFRTAGLKTVKNYYSHRQNTVTTREQADNILSVLVKEG